MARFEGTLSIMGLFEYDPSIFDGMPFDDPVFPDWMREAVIANILFEGSDLEIMIPNHPVLKSYIKVWYKSHVREWVKLQETTTLEYNPINNYDRNEEIIEKTTRIDNNTLNRTTKDNNKIDIDGETVLDGSSGSKETGTSRDSRKITDTGTNTSETDNVGNQTLTNNGSSDGTTLNHVYAFNSSSYVPHDQTISDVKTNDTSKTDNSSTSSTTNNINNVQDQTGDANDTRDIHNTQNSTTTNKIGTVNTGEGSLQDVERGEGQVTREFSNHTSGNIGVTTSQQMIESEREVVKFNLASYIAGQFIERFCILIY